MKQLRKTTALLLALLMLLSSALLASCSGDGSQEGATSGEPETAAPDNRPRIIDAGEAKYTLVYPNNASAAVLMAMNRFVDNVEKETGVKLNTKSDMLRVGKEHDPETPEILFGATNYNETAQALEGIASDQYTIRQVGKKLVIAAHGDSYVVAAGNYFTSNLLKPNITADAAGKKTLYFAEYTLPSASAGQKLNINGHFLSEFSIIYPADAAGYASVAEQLKSAIEATNGVVLGVYADSSRKEGTCEILIGKTNRSVSQELYNEKRPELLSYDATVKGSKLQILCGGPFSAKECVGQLRFSLLNSAKEYTNGSHLSAKLAGEAPAKTAGADLRLMTTNVLAARWGEDNPNPDANTSKIPDVAERAEIYAAMLAKYQPDAVGLQETDHKWLQLLPQYSELLKSDYGIEYTWMYSVSPEDDTPNLTSILYRSDLYTLKASDFKDNSYWTNSEYHMRALAWVKLQSKQNTSKQFILLNTHWAQALEPASWLTKSVQEQISLVNELKSTHNVPVFCTGDYNSKSDSAEVATLLEGTGMQETMLQAAQNGTRINFNGGCGGVGSPRNGDTYIDHIFGSGNYDVLRYETILGNSVIWLSDHAPQFADIKLK